LKTNKLNKKDTTLNQDAMYGDDEGEKGKFKFPWQK
jgi:hypothetical protein